jgi:cytochrome c oxidase subunit 2
MAFWVIAEAPADYEIWADQQRGSAKLADDAQKRRGETVFLSSTCPMCHSIQGTSANGKMAPDLTHLASRAHLAAGTLPNRAGELAAWIVDPQRFKPGANMPGSSFSPDDLQALVAYLQSLT